MNKQQQPIRRSPRIQHDSLLKGIGTINMILHARYNKKENQLTLLVAWSGIDGEYWTPIENLSEPLECYDFLDPITRQETLQLYNTYLKRRDRLRISAVSPSPSLG